MAEACVVELESRYLTDEEGLSSDDFDVRVANMNRSNDNEVASSKQLDDEKSCASNDEIDNEIISDDEYNYSDDSVCSEDSCRDSEMTNAITRSSLKAAAPLNQSMNLDYPNGLFNKINDDRESSFPRQFNDNTRDKVRRMCLSANDNRYSSGNLTHFDPTISRPRRRNMSFTNAEMQRIEVENQYLLKKIMAHQKPQNRPTRAQSAQPRVSSSAINRRKLQKRIEEENMAIGTSCMFPAHLGTAVARRTWLRNRQPFIV